MGSNQITDQFWHIKLQETSDSHLFIEMSTVPDYSFMLIDLCLAVALPPFQLSPNQPFSSSPQTQLLAFATLRLDDA
jgi:hypothetical protein